MVEPLTTYVSMMALVEKLLVLDIYLRNLILRYWMIPSICGSWTGDTRDLLSIIEFILAILSHPSILPGGILDIPNIIEGRWILVMSTWSRNKTAYELRYWIMSVFYLLYVEYCDRLSKLHHSPLLCR